MRHSSSCNLFRAIDVYRRGLIEAIGYDADIKAAYHSAAFDNIIDAKDKSIIPGKNTRVLQSPNYLW